MALPWDALDAALETARDEADGARAEADAALAAREAASASAQEAARALGEDRLEQPTYAMPEGRVVGELRTNLAAVIDQWSDPVLTDLITRISGVMRMPS